MASHETVCILHSTEHDVHEEFTAFYANRTPVGSYHIIVSACRTKQVRLNAFADPEPIPPVIVYASVFESDVPIVVQYLHRDSRPTENALVSTIAYACDEEE
jgi:hypothetical protein